MLFEESLFVLPMPDVLLHGGLFHALSLLYVAARGLEDSVHLGTQADVFRNGAPGAHLSSCLAPSCSPCCAAGGLSGGQTCHRDLDAWPYSCTHSLSGSRGAGYQSLCRVAGSAHHIPP